MKFEILSMLNVKNLDFIELFCTSTPTYSVSFIAVSTSYFVIMSCSMTSITGLNNNEYQISRGKVCI